MEVRVGGRVPFPARDAWTVLPNGTVVVARVKDYHMDFISTTGAVTRGPAVPFTPVRVGEAEKAEYRDQARTGGGVAIVRTNDGSGTQSRAVTPPVEEPATWPATKPPFSQGGMFVGASGEIWVARNRAARDPVATYDVFSADGRLTGRVALPAKTRVVGLGAGGAIYTVRVDDDDLQYLQRFRG